MQLATPCCETGLASLNYIHARHGRALLYKRHLHSIRLSMRTFSSSA